MNKLNKIILFILIYILSFTFIVNLSAYAIEDSFNKAMQSYYWVREFSEGMAPVSKLKGGFEIWGYIDKTGKEIVPCKYDIVRPFKNGFAAVEVWVDLDGPEGNHNVYGFIDKSGKEIVPLKYESVEDFSDGMAVVRLNMKYGFVDNTGKEIVYPKYDEVSSFSEGFALVKLNNKIGFIDKTGKEVVPLIYDRASSFHGGLARVNLGYNKTTENNITYITYGKWGFINTSGEVIAPIKYDNAGDFTDYGLAMVNIGGSFPQSSGGPGLKFVAFTGGKWGFIDKSGKEVVELKYDRIWDFDFNDDFVEVEINNKWGYIDKIGNEVISPKYDVTSSFSEGLAAVEINNKWGFVDESGKEVIELKYDNAYGFSDGIARVEKAGLVSLIDKTGKEAISYKNISIINNNEVMPLRYTSIVNDKETAVDAYLINGDNYLKIRDIAMILNQTEKQFDISWNQYSNAIMLYSNRPYTTVGGELSTSNEDIKEINNTNTIIYLDEFRMDSQIFNINNSSYVKLSDIVDILDFEVTYNYDAKTININASEDYSAE